MSSDRRFEYEKGPRLDDERESAENDGERADEAESTDPKGNERAMVTVVPWKAGAVAGASAFAVVFAVLYRLAAAMDAAGAFGVENKPSRIVIAGLLDLANHGVMIEQGGEPISRVFRATGGLASHVTPLIPVVVLIATGYLLVRYVRLETRREAGLAVGSLVLCYAVPTAGLAAIARWTPEASGRAGQEAEPIAVAMGPSLFVAVGGTALVFAAIGAGVAALPQLTARR